jgi:hypothetical protein
MRYIISGFKDSLECDTFAKLMEFAIHGRVIVGSRDITEDDPGFDPDAAWDYNQEWIYDEADRSGHPWYPLAYALAIAGSLNEFPDETFSFHVRLSHDQQELIADAAAKVAEHGLTVRTAD